MTVCCQWDVMEAAWREVEGEGEGEREREKERERGRGRARGQTHICLEGGGRAQAQGLLPEIHDQNPALTVLHVPYSTVS